MLLSYHQGCSSTVSHVRDKLSVQQRILFTVISCYKRNYSDYDKHEQQGEEKFNQVCPIIRTVWAGLELNVTNFTLLEVWEFWDEDKLRALARACNYFTSPDIIFTSAFSFWYDFIDDSSWLSIIFITTFYRFLEISFCRILPVNVTGLLFWAY